MRLRISLVVAVVLVAGALAARPAQAAPVLGAQLSYTGGDVTVQNLPATAGFMSELGLYDAAFNRLTFLVINQPIQPPVTFNPGALGIGVGSELIFGIRVLSDSNREYFMGPAVRNPDNLIHAAVDNLGGGVFIVGFEDLFGGGDRDYDDNIFRFTGAIQAVPVPEPGVLLLLGAGLAGALRRRARRSQSVA